MRTPQEMTTAELNALLVEKYRMVVRELYPTINSVVGRFARHVSRKNDEVITPELDLLYTALFQLSAATDNVYPVREILDHEEAGVLTPEFEYEMLMLCEDEINEVGTPDAE